MIKEEMRLGDSVEDSVSKLHEMQRHGQCEQDMNNSSRVFRHLLTGHPGGKPEGMERGQARKTGKLPPNKGKDAS